MVDETAFCEVANPKPKPDASTERQPTYPIGFFGSSENYRGYFVNAETGIDTEVFHNLPPEVGYFVGAIVDAAILLETKLVQEIVKRSKPANSRLIPAYVPESVNRFLGLLEHLARPIDAGSARKPGSNAMLILGEKTTDYDPIKSRYQTASRTFSLADLGRNRSISLLIATGDNPPNSLQAGDCLSRDPARLVSQMDENKDCPRVILHGDNCTMALVFGKKITGVLALRERLYKVDKDVTDQSGENRDDVTDAESSGTRLFIVKHTFELAGFFRRDGGSDVNSKLTHCADKLAQHVRRRTEGNRL